MNLAHCHKFLWVINKGNITLEEKKEIRGETTALNLAAISSSGFI